MVKALKRDEHVSAKMQGTTKRLGTYTVVGTDRTSTLSLLGDLQAADAARQQQQAHSTNDIHPNVGGSAALVGRL